jgi:predicted GIY-YIG superfamily endonuclease
MYYVYWIFNPGMSDYKKEGYIGFTNNFDRRMLEHKRKPSGILKNAIKKYGWENLDKVVLCTIDDLELACLAEQELRPYNNIGWNLAIGGETPVFYGENNVMSKPEQRRRASESQKGALNHQYGKRHSEEHKRKIKENSAAFKGPIEAVNINTQEKLVFNGKTELINFGFNPNCVYCCLNPKQRQKQHKGYTFKRLETTE